MRNELSERIVTLQEKVDGLEHLDSWDDNIPTEKAVGNVKIRKTWPCAVARYVGMAHNLGALDSQTSAGYHSILPLIHKIRSPDYTPTREDIQTITPVVRFAISCLKRTIESYKNALSDNLAAAGD